MSWKFWKSEKNWVRHERLDPLLGDAIQQRVFKLGGSYRDSWVIQCPTKAVRALVEELLSSCAVDFEDTEQPQGWVPEHEWQRHLIWIHVSRVTSGSYYDFRPPLKFL